MKKETFDKESFRSFKQGNYSRSDYRAVRHWFSLKNHIGLKDGMRDHWQELPVDQLLNARLQALNRKLIGQVESKRPNKKIGLLNYYQKIAAVLFIPLILGISYWLLCPIGDQSIAMATIHSPLGARTEFVLPDGTNGWLNSGSELAYPVEFSNSREVNLKGEAFFNVTKKNGRKFRVKADEITVQVLGTSFNVEAYENESEISVVLKEGLVKIFDANDQETYTMAPGEKFDYQIDKKEAKISQVDADEQTLWTNGILRFNGETMLEVVKKLGRWYNVDFEIRDDRLKNYCFKATFKDEQLVEILRMMALTTPMKFEIQERKLNKNEIYEKNKIIITWR